MITNTWIAVIITSCSRPFYWYNTMVGQTVIVKKWNESSWGVQEKSTGYQIADCDFEIIH